MEGSVLSSKYMNLGIEDAYDYIKGIKDKTKKHGGNFTLLWHDSNLKHDRFRDLYLNLIQE